VGYPHNPQFKPGNTTLVLIVISLLAVSELT